MEKENKSKPPSLSIFVMRQKANLSHPLFSLDFLVCTNCSVDILIMNKHQCKQISSLLSLSVSVQSGVINPNNHQRVWNIWEIIGNIITILKTCLCILASKLHYRCFTQLHFYSDTFWQQQQTNKNCQCLSKFTFIPIKP